MASLRSSESGAREGAVGDAFQLVAQGLAQLQEALRLEKQEAEREVQEAEHRMQEALRLQEERAATALREMERKLQEKDHNIRALQQRLRETQKRVTAVEKRRTSLEGSGGEWAMQRLEGRVNEVEASLQRALQTFMPRVEAVLKRLEEPQSPRASLTTAASAREAPATGGAAAGGGEEPPSSTPTPTSSGAAANEEKTKRQRVRLHALDIFLRMEEAQISPCPLGAQLCVAAKEGRLSDVRRAIESGADVDYIDRDGLTPLFNAVNWAEADVVSLLLELGADPKGVTCYGESALHWAAREDPSGRCVELLLRAGADVDAWTMNGATPLYYAAHYNNEKAVRALLAAGARRDFRGLGGVWKNKTPFEVATSCAVQDLLRMLGHE